MERRTIDIDTLNNYGEVNFELPIGEDFGNNLLQKELFNESYIEKVKEENINPIVDYEKHIFYPAYFKGAKIDVTNGKWIDEGVVTVSNKTVSQSDDLDEYADDMNSIRFNVFLRRRDPDENGDYGEWNTSDEQYWNRWNGTLDSSNQRVMDNERSIKNYGDLLGYMGFNDNDVFYQKNALKKTFLRISIFDSPYRQSQRLLYYSTLFLDSNVLYKKYTNLSGKGLPVYSDTKEFVTPLVYQSATSGSIVIPSSELLTTTFTCTSRYDESASSDGFYLYLFETMAREGLCTPLYMKVELNNAKYGKSVPLMSPRNFTVRKQGNINVGCPYDIENDKFPEDFTVPYTSNGQTNYYVDINKMYESLYIPIFVRYNNKKNRFEWYIVDNRDTGGDMVINLYEPRINKLQEPITT